MKTANQRNAIGYTVNHDCNVDQADHQQHAANACEDSRVHLSFHEIANDGPLQRSVRRHVLHFG